MMLKTSAYTILLLLLFSAAGAQESMMGDVSAEYLQKLIATAKSNYPKTKAYESRVRIAEINVQKARFDWFNIFSFTYLYSPNNSTTIVNPNLLNGYQIGATTTVGNILQRPGAVRSAKEEYAIALYNQEEYDLNLETIVKQRYYAYVQQRTLLNWRMKAIETADNSMKDIKHKFEKGEETYLNYNSAFASYSSAVQYRIEAESAFLIAKSNLEEIIGAKLESIK